MSTTLSLSVALGILLSASACGKSADQQASPVSTNGGGSTGGPSASPSASAVATATQEPVEAGAPRVLNVDTTIVKAGNFGKAAGYSASPTSTIVTPARWQNTAGWSEENATSVVSLPNYIAYAADGYFRFYDKAGTIVAQVKEEAGATINISTMKRDGKIYVSHSSTKNKTTTITSFDQNANQISKVTLDGTPVSTGFGDFSVRGSDNKKVRVFDPVTGSLRKIVEEAGASWAGTIDGVDVFVVSDPSKSKRKNIGVFTEKWEKPFEGIVDPIVNGYVALKAGGSCEIVNVHSGEALQGTEGACPVDPSEFLNASADGMALDKAGHPVLVLPATPKSFPVTSAGSFYPTSVDADGTFYIQVLPHAQGGELAVFTMNPKTDTNLKYVEDGATRTPVAITNNGIAAFVTGQEISDSGTMEFRVAK